MGSLPLPGPRNPLRTSRSVADSSQCMEVRRQEIGGTIVEASRDTPSPEVLQMSTVTREEEDQERIEAV